MKHHHVFITFLIGLTQNVAKLIRINNMSKTIDTFRFRVIDVKFSNRFHQVIMVVMVLFGDSADGVCPSRLCW